MLLTLPTVMEALARVACPVLPTSSEMVAAQWKGETGHSGSS